MSGLKSTTDRVAKTWCEGASAAMNVWPKTGAMRMCVPEFLALDERSRRMRQWVRCSTRMSTEIVDNSNIISAFVGRPLRRCKSMTDSG
jgi:hypothetical protein